MREIHKLWNSQYKFASAPHQEKVLHLVNDEWIVSTKTREQIEAGIAKRARDKETVKRHRSKDYSHEPKRIYKRDEIMDFLSGRLKSLTVAEIANGIGMSAKAVRNAMHKLKKAGMVIEGKLKHPDAAHRPLQTWVEKA